MNLDYFLKVFELHLLILSKVEIITVVFYLKNRKEGK